MPFLRVVKRPHSCFLPTSINRRRGGRAIGPGTIWACDYCGTQYIVKEKEDGEIDKYTGLHELYWDKLAKKDYISFGE